jgi:hypothetical protein
MVTQGLVEKAALADTVSMQIHYTPTFKGFTLLTIIDALQ